MFFVLFELEIVFKFGKIWESNEVIGNKNNVIYLSKDEFLDLTVICSVNLLIRLDILFGSEDLLITGKCRTNVHLLG